MKNPAAGAFRALSIFNFRVWSAGALVSNIGTWMQRVAQDWLVLTQLTHHDASAVGIVMALQFATAASFVALDRICRGSSQPTQAPDGHPSDDGGVSAGFGNPYDHGQRPSLASLCICVFVWLGGRIGCSRAPDFVAELVGDEHLHNAVALNSTSFNAGRMVGPAVAGLVIAKVGTGWAFAINGLSFAAVLISMSLFRVSELYPNTRAPRTAGGFLEGFRYVWRRRDLRAILVMLFLVGTFGLNFPIFTSTMAVNVFHTDARGFGLLSSIMAIGTISGALISAGRDRPKFGYVTLRLSALRDRMHFRCAGPRLLVVRRCSCGHWCCSLDTHQRDQQHDAALDGTCHARPSHGPSPRCRAWRHADRSSDRGLGGKPFRSPVGTGRRRVIGVCRCAGCHIRPDAAN